MISSFGGETEKYGLGSWQQPRMPGGPLDSEVEGQMGLGKHNPLQSHSGCCKGSDGPQPGHRALGKVQAAPWSLSCSSG